MSQELNVLRCYSCKIYQVHIVKKARKWRCKLCNAKQSVQQIYFQGSGKDCRLNVQHLNYLKANDTSLSLHPERDDNNDSFNTTSIPQESGINKATESKWAKYLDSPKKKSPSNAEDSSSDDIHEAEDMTTNEKSLWNAVKNDSCNFENIADDGSFESEVADEAEKLHSTNFNYNPNTEDKSNLQDSSKSSRDHNDAASIFETYDELDEPLDI